MTDNGKSITNRVIAVLIVLILAAYGIIVADTRTSITTNAAKIEAVMERKVEKEQYYRDIGDIKNTLTAMDGKLDRMRR
uniref:Uncharacterized protein n=1 Tax=viral metagenome TaxID=1070528 RepID=A0A6H2A2W4_9ZZZZ